jgi:hypothetical protein
MISDVKAMRTDSRADTRTFRLESCCLTENADRDTLCSVVSELSLRVLHASILESTDPEQMLHPLLSHQTREPIGTFKVFYEDEDGSGCHGAYRHRLHTRRDPSRASSAYLSRNDDRPAVI